MAPPTEADLASHQSRIFGSAGCLVSGAGTAAHMEALLALLRERFSAEPHLDTADVVQPAFAEILNEFHEDYLAPFRACAFDDRPTVEVIAGYMFNNGVGQLLVSQENLIRKVSPYVAIEAGSTLARTLLGRFYRLPLLDVWQTVLLATYVMYQVKESVDGCGKRTDICCLMGGQSVGMVSIPRRQAEELERAIVDYCDVVDVEQFRWVVGDTTEPGGKRTAVRKRLAKLMAEVSAPPKNA